MVTITPVAEQKIQELMKEEKDVVGLRIYVRGGGCHGYQYGMAFESKMAEDDTVIEKGDVKVIMDSQSAPLLQGAEVDRDGLGGVLAAIDDGGDQALLARLIGRALAASLAGFDLKFLNLRHFSVL